MFTTLVVSFINLITDLLNNFLPKFSYSSSFLDKAQAAVSTVVDFVVAVNFLVPLPDIMLIIGIDLGIRLFKSSLFIGNLIINKILEALP